VEEEVMTVIPTFEGRVGLKINMRGGGRKG